jgi:hypothetical protein
MPRTILTFATLHRVLQAEKALRADTSRAFKCRPTPTPPGLSESICGMSIELMEPAQTELIVQFLHEHELAPSGVHRLA